MVIKDILARFRSSSAETEEQEVEERIDIRKDTPVNLVLGEFKKWGGPGHYKKLLEALKTSAHRRKETTLVYQLKQFSKRLGDVPKKELEGIVASLDPETIVEKIPLQRDDWLIEKITLIDNVEGKSYLEALAVDQHDKSKMARLCLYDGEWVEKDYAYGKKSEGSGFVYGEARIVKAGDKKRVVFLDKSGRAYDDIDLLIDYNEKKLAYVGRSGDDRFLVIDDKERFGQFDYSLYTSQIVREHLDGLSRKGRRRVENVLGQLDPMIKKKTEDTIEILTRFSKEYLSQAQAADFKQILLTYYDPKRIHEKRKAAAN